MQQPKTGVVLLILLLAGVPMVPIVSADNVSLSKHVRTIKPVNEFPGKNPLVNSICPVSSWTT